MTNGDWKYMEEELDRIYGRVELLCDGYRVQFQYGAIGKRLFIHTAYINGWFKGSWLLDDCEERRRFYRKRSVFALPLKLRKLEKKLGKRILRQRNIDPDKRIDHYDFKWTSFNQLKKHLIANNNSIELAPSIYQCPVETDLKPVSTLEEVS